MDLGTKKFGTFPRVSYHTSIPSCTVLDDHTPRLRELKPVLFHRMTDSASMANPSAHRITQAECAIFDMFRFQINDLDEAPDYCTVLYCRKPIPTSTVVCRLTRWLFVDHVSKPQHLARRPSRCPDLQCFMRICCSQEPSGRARRCLCNLAPEQPLITSSMSDEQSATMVKPSLATHTVDLSEEVKVEAGVTITRSAN